MIIVDGKYLSQRVTGVQRYALETIAQWQRMGYDFSIARPPTRRVGFWEQSLRAGRGNLLWCPTNTGPLLGGDKVVTLHDGAVFHTPAWFSPSYRHWRRTAIPLLAKGAKAIITVSEFSRSVLVDLARIPARKIHVVPNGVNTELFRPVAVNTELLCKYRIDRPYLLTVGSLDPRKNLPTMLDAWGRLPAHLRDEFQFVVVGGSAGTFLKMQFAEDKSCVFAGYVPDADLPALYSAARGFVYPSLFEGFGLPVLEAMACGVPVITSSTTALPEVAGGLATLVDPSNVDSLAEEMSVLLRQALDAQKRQALIAHACTYTWRASAEHTWQILNESMR